MSVLSRTGAMLFSLLLRLYPAAFREEFGVEMQGVFEEKMAEEQRAGAARNISLVFCEMADLTIRASAERVNVWCGKENAMSDNLQRVRIFAVLSPVILAMFLLIINPKYTLRLFSDPLGWEVVLALLLGLGISLMLWSAPIPAETGRRRVQEFALLSILLLADLLIILGPAIVMVLGPSSSVSAGREYSPLLMRILLAVNGMLAGVVIVMVIKRMRAARRQAG